MWYNLQAKATEMNKLDRQLRVHLKGANTEAACTMTAALPSMHNFSLDSFLSHFVKCIIPQFCNK